MRWLSGTSFPRVPGYDVAGILLDDEPRPAAGARVHGMIQSQRGGECAEVALLREDGLAAAPIGVDTAETSSLPLAGLTALQALTLRR